MVSPRVQPLLTLALSSIKFKVLSRLEGIIPAIESSHAIAYALNAAKEYDKDDYIIVCLSGRGDKDVQELMDKIK